jgi:hypothetical protein
MPSDCRDAGIHYSSPWMLDKLKYSLSEMTQVVSLRICFGVAIARPIFLGYQKFEDDYEGLCKLSLQAHLIIL